MSELIKADNEYKEWIAGISTDFRKSQIRASMKIAANIRGALDAVNGKYKSVIIMRLIRGYSWTKISGKLGVPDSTARNWHGRAVERLGEVLEEVPMVDELAERATRART